MADLNEKHDAIADIKSAHDSDETIDGKRLCSMYIICHVGACSPPMKSLHHSQEAGHLGRCCEQTVSCLATSSDRSAYSKSFRSQAWCVPQGFPDGYGRKEDPTDLSSAIIIPSN